MIKKVPLNVLIVEDDPLILDQLTRLVSKKCDTVHTATNGAEGLICFQTHSFDMVISDLDMPVMGGLELLQAIRLIDEEMPFILCTGLSDHETLVTAIEYNITGFIPKPVKNKALFKKIDKIADYKKIKQEVITLDEMLKNEKQNLEAALKAKSEFLANMSHEIRTPMNGIFGFTTLLQKSNLNEKQKEYLDIIETSNKTLLGVINDILDFSKIESGSLELDPTTIDPHKEFEKMGRIFLPKMEEKQIDFTIEIDALIPECIKVDLLRLQQIITNLIGNAVKFTPEKGKIDLDIRLFALCGDKCSIRFGVKDNGIGITESQKEKIFDQFSQADMSIARQYGGTGLGLSISKQLIELMGGKLLLESTIGEGSEFYFDIWVDGCNSDTLLLPAHPCLSTNPRTYSGSVLVADDNKINRYLFQEMFMHYGLVPEMVDNGQEALNKIFSKPFDLIFLDINMPLMDGVKVLNIAKAQKIKTPIVALTANAMEGDREKYLEDGFDAYLSKPIMTDALERILNQYLLSEENTTVSSPLTAHNLKSDEVSSRLDIDRIKEELPFADKILNELFETFLSIIPTSMLELGKAITDRDYSAIEHQAHSLRGMASNLRLTRVEEIANIIEKSSSIGKEIDYVALNNELENVIKSLSLEMEEYIKRNYAFATDLQH